MFFWERLFKRAEPDDPLETDFAKIAQSLRKKRGATVAVDLLSEEERAGLPSDLTTDPIEARNLVGDYIRQFRYYMYNPADWEWLTREQAKTILENLIWRDMAYGVEVFERKVAEAYAQAFIDQLNPGAVFFSNCDYPEGIGEDRPSYGWQGISAATFDSGVVALDRDRIGILWVEDED